MNHCLFDERFEQQILRELASLRKEVRELRDEMKSASIPKAKPKRKQESTEDPGFTAFWSLYPRKLAKPAALRAWRSLNQTQRQVAERVLPDWIESWKNTDMKFIPHASTWLNQHRFNDEVEQAIPEEKENLNKLTDDELYQRAQSMGISTMGLNRFELIDRIQTR